MVDIFDEKRETAKIKSAHSKSITYTFQNRKNRKPEFAFCISVIVDRCIINGEQRARAILECQKNLITVKFFFMKKA